MRKATDLELKQFATYRALHIALVERLGALVFNEDYSNHDWDKCTCTEEELNLFALRNAMLNGDYKPSKEDKAVLSKLPAKHVKMNKHHPEYWDENITIRKFSDENPPQVNAERMPKRWIREMCCDWTAVSLKKNNPIFKWYNETCTGDNPRFVFTDSQKKYIISCLNSIMETVEKENVSYPGIKYDAKQVEPVETLKEYMTKEEPNQIEGFANEIKNHGLENHDLPDCLPCESMYSDVADDWGNNVKVPGTFDKKDNNQIEKFATMIKNHGLERHDLPNHTSYGNSSKSPMTKNSHSQIKGFANAIKSHGLERHDLPGHKSYSKSGMKSIKPSDKNQVSKFANAIKDHGLERHDLPGDDSWNGQISESMTKYDKDQILHFADEIKYHGLEHHDLPGHIAWDGLIKDGKKYPSFRENLEIEPDLVKTKECEMSGSFSTSAPEKVIKVVDPSGTLDNETDNKEKGTL